MAVLPGLPLVPAHARRSQLVPPGMPAIDHMECLASWPPRRPILDTTSWTSFAVRFSGISYVRSIMVELLSEGGSRRKQVSILISMCS